MEKVVVQVINIEKFNAMVIQVNTDNLVLKKEGFNGSLGLDTEDGMGLEYIHGYHGVYEYLEDYGFILAVREV